MARDTHHVVHNPNGGWGVKRGNGQKSSVHTETKTEAEVRASEISHNQKTELIIHGLDGKIQRSYNHGNDPCPPKINKLLFIEWRSFVSLKRKQSAILAHFFSPLQKPTKLNSFCNYCFDK